MNKQAVKKGGKIGVKRVEFVQKVEKSYFEMNSVCSTCIFFSVRMYLVKISLRHSCIFV